MYVTTNSIYGNFYTKNIFNNQVKYKKSQVIPTEIFDSEECCICRDNIVYDLVRRLSCKHYFHIGCIDMWLSKNMTCPVCRRKIVFL